MTIEPLKRTIGGCNSQTTRPVSKPAPEVPNILQLQRLLGDRDHQGFLEAFSGMLGSNTVSQQREYLGALGGEGLCLLLESRPKPSMPLAKRYCALLLEGSITAPRLVIEELARLLKSAALVQLAGTLDSDQTRASAKDASHAIGDSGIVEPNASLQMRRVVQVRRVVQIMQMLFGNGQYSDAEGIRRSIFRSQQERTFMRALALRFPGLLALPNYPFDQIADLERLRAIDTKTLRYARLCRLDAILVIPDEGDPVAAFELDSRHHDSPEARRRDSMKNSLMEAARLPFFRLRADSPESMSVDEWYALLSDQVLPHIDLGARIRCRQAAYSLVPC